VTMFAHNERAHYRADGCGHPTGLFLRGHPSSCKTVLRVDGNAGQGRNPFPICGLTCAFMRWLVLA
jgi:hypothetical protein